MTYEYLRENKLPNLVLLNLMCRQTTWGSCKNPDSGSRGRETEIPRFRITACLQTTPWVVMVYAGVLKSWCVSESSGGLLKKKIARPLPQIF